LRSKDNRFAVKRQQICGQKTTHIDNLLFLAIIYSTGGAMELEQKNPNQNSLIVKDNVLIPQLAKFELSELRFLAYCLAHYNSKENKNRQIVVRVADLCEFFPMHESSAYRVIKQVILSLAKKPAEFQIEKKIYLYHWFSGLEYGTDTGEFTFRISAEMEPYLLGLAGNFTKWRLGDVYQFKAASTWKLYENMAQWKTTGKWVVKLDELRLRLGVAGQYPRWNSLQQRIIAPSVKEINAVSDLRVDYSQEKKGRRVIGLVFLIDKRVDDNVITIENPKQTVYKQLLDCQINEKIAAEFSKKIDDMGETDRISSKIPEIKERWQKSPKKTSVPLQKYILGAINDEIRQLKFKFEVENKKTVVPDHSESLNCWLDKRQKGEKCPVRVRGEAGQRKKCQICFEKLPVDTWDV
jgi:plasmid replication initiation protein